MKGKVVNILRGQWILTFKRCTYASKLAKIVFQGKTYYWIGWVLKGYYGGQILVAIERDPNDQMLPIVFVVVEGETKYSWIWFLELLTADLWGIRLCKTYTFISDQQKVDILIYFTDFIVVYIFSCFKRVTGRCLTGNKHLPVINHNHLPDNHHQHLPLRQ